MLFSGIWDDFTMISTVQWVDRDTHTHVPMIHSAIPLSITPISPTCL